MTQRQPIGIDLGTTYSAMATLDANGRSQMLRNAEGDVLTPSVVLFDAGEIVVGKFAKKAVATHADRVAECAKRDMGQAFYSRPIGGQQLPPEVIQACILKKLRQDAGPAMGSAGVVITVPAYFDEPRRKATADAAEMAGLDVLDIVNEPTAAALAFGEQLGYLSAGGEFREPMKVLVYDLGGGTFDVTVISLSQGDIRTLATDGDVELGGRDWDQRLAEHVAAQFRQKSGADLHADPAAWNQLMAQVEQAKHTLSSRDRAVLHVEHSGRSEEIGVSREEFARLTDDLLERTAFTTRQVVAAAHLDFKDLSRILLVGGSTRMPRVSAMLKQLSGITADLSLSPDEAVARGAAIYAGYLLAKEHGSPAGPPAFKVTDVNSHSLGIQGIDQATMLKENVIVIARNTPLPAVARQRFATQSAGQRSIVVQVLEGESTQPHLCSRIGRSVLSDLPPGLPQGSPIEITFEYGTNGRLNVRAEVPGTDRSLLIELERERGLSSERLNRWKQLLRGDGAGEVDVDQLLAEALELPVALAAPSGTLQANVPLGTRSSDVPLAARPAAVPLGATIAAAPLDAGEPTSFPAPSAGPMQPGRSASPAALAVTMPLATGPESDAAPLEFGELVRPSLRGPAAAAKMPGFLRRQPARSRRRFQPLLNLLGHLVASTVGLTIGYIILCWVNPRADFLGIFHRLFGK